MKYPMAYWAGRMSGVLSGIVEFCDVPEYIKTTCKDVVEEFEKDFNEEEQK